jgi:rSAM/selenodomain-associated transferase 2
LNLSVVVPVWNEASTIDAFVRHVRSRLPMAEIVLVDGGSNDGTWQKLQRLADRHRLRLLRSPRGRTRQMNRGAEASRGEVILFLHADSRLPHSCAGAIARLLQEQEICGGCFRLRFPRQELIYRISDSLGNLAVDLFQIALGDHGIFCRRDTFFRIGGFPEVPLMEDADFYRALKRQGRVRQLRDEIETSPRRYEELGRHRTTFFYLLLLALYLLGVSHARLAEWHRRFTERSPARRRLPADAFARA